jgi:hypothetical protein
MPCSVHQSLFDSDKRIWEAWKHLNDKTTRGVAETEEMHRLARSGGDSSHAVKEHITACLECHKPNDETDS